MLLAACGSKSAITETRMVHAPAREMSCPLELVQVDVTSSDFNKQWDVLGHVTLMGRGTQDPMAEENRSLVRGRACNMGGTAIGVAMNSTNTNQLGQQGSAISYMVLRPKATAPAAPTAF